MFDSIVVSAPNVIDTCLQEERDFVEVVPNKQLLGKEFRGDSKALIDALVSLSISPNLPSHKESLQKDGCVPCCASGNILHVIFNDVCYVF